MRRILIIGAALFALIGPAKAADSTVPAMTAGSAFADTDLMYCVQSAGTLDRKCTPLQMAAYVFGKVTGSLSCTGTGTCTVTTNANLTGDVTSVGNATTLTNAPVIAKVLTGFTSGAGTVSAADSILSALQKINGNVALNAPLASPAFTGVPTAPTATVGTNTTQLATTAFVLANAGSGAVSSVTGGIGVTVSPTTGAVVVSSPATRRDNTATTDTITSTDKGTIVTENNASAVAVAITTAGFVTTDYFTIKNKGAGLATYTPSSGTINGAATIACAQNQSADLYFDGTNYQTLANNCGATTTIAHGTFTVPNTVIGAGACGSAITVSAPGVATTDVVTAGFSADPTVVTGFLPTAMLTIVPYPTSGNANFKPCNLTASSITPTSTTLNFSVTR